MNAPAPDPLVSVVVANFNGAPFLRDALRSLERQSLSNIEVIVVDDASTDDSVSIVRSAAQADPRIGLIALPANQGPAAARNHALARARGRWIAVMDSDDFMHPDRLSRLVAAGDRHGADIVADDCLVFDDLGAFRPASLLRAYGATERWIELEEFVASNEVFGRGPALGYLKPIFRREAIERAQLRYDEGLRIAEDYDFVARLMLAGARFRLETSIGYFYRKHSLSISHRLKGDQIDAILEADDRFRSAKALMTPALVSALDRRRRSLLRARHFTGLVDALKRGSISDALSLAWRKPEALPLLRNPVVAKVRGLVRGRKPAAAPSDGSKRAYVISRQRVVGNTNGSSAYLISICKALRDGGYEVHLVAPSPAVFGRWPVLRFAPEMQVFSSIQIRGSWRFGSLAVARDPRIALRAALTVAERLLGRVGIHAGWVKPAPYSIGLPWTRADEIYLAGAVRGRARFLLADYAFLTPGFAYCLQPAARTAVVMHDLFSARTGQFQKLGASDSVAVLDEEAEMRLLGNAEAILAIQPHEARVVQDRLPHRRVIVAPMAVEPVHAPQPGAGRSMLFVGSNTAPNVLGLQWFLDEVWPLIRQSDPQAVVNVAGGVCNAVRTNAEGVRLLGFVSDLDALYRDAAVVISPLQVGSGLKIKLIEALGKGKAIVATSTTVEGVEAEVADAVFVRDDAAGFAESVLRLLDDSELRQARCEAALATANRHFTAAACYREVLRFADGDPPATGVPAETRRLGAEVR